LFEVPHVTSVKLRHMKAIVKLSDRLLEQAKREATRRGETLTALIEQGLPLVLASSVPQHRRKRVNLPICRAVGGVLPGVDLNDSSRLSDTMEGRP